MKHACTRTRGLLVALVIALAALLPAGAASTAAAPGDVPVWYDSFNNIIYIGSDYDPTSPYAGWPAHPSAPKSPISIPQVAAALNNPALLADQGGGAWLLRANLVISATARLEATSATIGWLRLDSTPGTRFPSLTSITARGGHLLIQGIRVSSWAGGGVDTNYFDGRSYLLAELGGRMDILDAEVSHLGWSAGEPSGLAWRKTATEGDPTDPNVIKTGATGSIKHSDIHDNYFGQYSYEAYGLAVLNNQFHHNVLYGFDPHDYSTGFEVAYNKVFSNGKHGIIFSRGCTLNTIHDNEVFGNAEHGIMLDRGSNVNQISNNLVYNNRDGVAIFQSEKNLIQNNTLRDNERGVRINATFDQGDLFDGLASENTILNNNIRDNLQYGIYLYERADKNTIQGNTIAGNTGAGVYVKTGGNLIKANTITGNGDGISIVGGDPPTPGGIPASYAPGHKNVIQGNTIENNDDVGIQLQGGVDTLIGLKELAPGPSDANLIRTNGTHGISLDATSAKNTLYGNTIHGNGSDGVAVKGPAGGPAADSRNTITRNSITANGRAGISVDPTANRGIQPPAITSAAGASVVTGTAAPGARVEVYRDANGQGQFFKGAASANGAGAWSFSLPDNNSAEGGVTALQIDQFGNTSALFGTVVGGKAVYEVGAGRNGDLTIFVSGPGAIVTLPDIQQGVAALSDKPLLQNQGGGVWQANASLFFNRGVTLTLGLDTASWLKLRSQPGDIALSAAGAGTYNYKSFATLRTYGGAILIDGVRVTSWDPAANDYDRDISNGRSYVLAKYDARMDIKNADMSYLGSADGESYGVAWRDINDPLAPDVLRTRVTGSVLNSSFSYNYYGIYTFQASTMLFEGNAFHHNIGYGFDPHDFSHHFMVLNNRAFANGNHGFIISRGCNNFVFKGNAAYDNRYTLGDGDRKAHGFMLDPGSPNSRFEQVPSHDNLLEANQAWGNDGYGLRIVGSNTNTVRGNTFTGNLQGITLEQGSTGNSLLNNTIAGSQLYGIYLIGGADGNTIDGNTITHSGKHGIYIKTGKNTVTRNSVSENGSLEGITRVGSGIATLPETSLAAALADFIPPGQHASLADAAPELLGPPELASAVDGNVITQNTLIHNISAGIELKGAVGTRVEGNLAQLNGFNGIYLSAGTRATLVRQNVAVGNVGHGIRANGADVLFNRWEANSVYANSVGGIAITAGANGGARPPTFSVQGTTVRGTAAPGATIEIFSDNGQQARFFEGRVTAGSDGTFTFTAGTPWQGPNINALATDTSANSSALTFNVGEFVAFAHVYLPLARR
ncbi:MAG: right-handed parallel beta-helix repeat-containing protein [Kouleothrix sp.]